MISKMLAKQKQKASSVNSATNYIDLLHAYCKDIDNWPDEWEIAEEDIVIGKSITEQFIIFLIDRIDKGRAKKTIKNDATYLWVLGGELIRAINENEAERQLPARALILKYIDESGGPYWRHAFDETEHSRYDSVCKQLFKFITTNFN
jgi:hypothetical protein